MGKAIILESFPHLLLISFLIKQVVFSTRSYGHDTISTIYQDYKQKLNHLH